MSVNQDELMQAMLAAGNGVVGQMPGMVVPPIMPQMGASQPLVAPVIEQPVAPVMPVMAPQAPVIEQPHAPVMAPVIEQPVAPQAPAAPIVHVEQPAPVIEQPTAPVAPHAPVMPAMAPAIEQQAPVMPAMAPAIEQQATQAAVAPQTQVVGEVIQNGLELDYVMTPEAGVQLTVSEATVEPIKLGGLESIGNCKTSVWSALLTILDFIAKELSNNDIIAIDKGTIDTHRNGMFIHCDMQNILGNISLNLTAPDTSVKLLKTIKGGQLVQIFKEEATNSYMFCNVQDGKVQTRVKTNFAADSGEGFGKAPLLGNPVFQKEIPNAEKEIIKTIIAGKSAIGADEPFRFGFSKNDNSLVSIGVGKNFTYFFQDSSIEVDEYRCYNPFPVPNMDSCIIRFFKKADDNTTWIQTVSNINPSSIICTEKVELIDSSIEDFDFN